MRTVEPPREVGLSPVNRVGVAPDREGTARICFAGDHQSLAYLAGIEGASRWAEWNCLSLPLNRTSILAVETFGKVQEATDAYVEMRGTWLAAPHEHASRYPPAAPGEPEPFPHQVDWFCRALEARAQGWQGFANLGEMGTGKTRTAIDLMRHLVTDLGLVVCQNSTTGQWQRHIERSWPEAEVVPLFGMPLKNRNQRLQELRGSRPVSPSPKILLVNWEALYPLLTPLSKLSFAVGVFDEASRIKERTTKMSKAAHRLAKRIAFRVPMTGTPFGNSPGDIWSIYRFLDERLFGSSYWEFARRYFRLGGFTGYEITEFEPAQTGPFLERTYAAADRVTKATVTGMPPKLFETILLAMEPEQQTLYQQAELDLYVKRVDADGWERRLSIPNALVQVTRLQQITAGLFPANDGEEGKADCQTIPSAKTNWVVDYLADAIRDGDGRYVVWCRFVPEITELNRRLRERLGEACEVGIVRGGMKRGALELIRQQFNDRASHLRVMICQIQAAAYGLDIPQADGMIYASLSYSFLEWAQSMERGHRLGRTRPYQIITPLLKGTVDERIFAALQKKRDLSEMLLIDGFERGEENSNLCSTNLPVPAKLLMTAA